MGGVGCPDYCDADYDYYDNDDDDGEDDDDNDNADDDNNDCCRLCLSENLVRTKMVLAIMIIWMLKVTLWNHSSRVAAGFETIKHSK